MLGLFGKTEVKQNQLLDGCKIERNDKDGIEM
jgi:hypothetical protein